MGQAAFSSGVQGPLLSSGGRIRFSVGTGLPKAPMCLLAISQGLLSQLLEVTQIPHPLAPPSLNPDMEKVPGMQSLSHFKLFQKSLLPCKRFSDETDFIQDTLLSLKSTDLGS